MISEQEKEKIKKEARDILDSFDEQLNGIDFPEIIVEKKFGGFRVENREFVKDDSFRERMFKNAPKHDGDFIIAEKKKW